MDNATRKCFNACAFYIYIYIYVSSSHKSDATISHTVSEFYLLHVKIILCAKYVTSTVKSLENFISIVSRGY